MNIDNLYLLSIIDINITEWPDQISSLNELLEKINKKIYWNTSLFIPTIHSKTNDR